jgi:hypothetical protein
MGGERACSIHSEGNLPTSGFQRQSENGHSSQRFNVLLASHPPAAQDLHRVGRRATLFLEGAAHQPRHVTGILAQLAHSPPSAGGWAGPTAPGSNPSANFPELLKITFTAFWPTSKPV